ncbi:MAG: radical SAM protein [Caldilineales bacterium]
MAPPEVLLVSPPDYETREFRGAQPLGIAYLAASLRAAAVSVRLLDANVNGPLPFAHLLTGVDDFLRHAGQRPVVGVSVVSQVLPVAVRLAEWIKAQAPTALVIFGGYHPTFAANAILEDFAAVDLCVRGEGEQTIVEIMQRWQSSAALPAATDWSGIAGVTWRSPDGITPNLNRPNTAQLDTLPFPARDLLPPLNAYAPYADTVAGTLRIKASMISSRGCPFHCNFCSIIAFYNEAGGRSWRGRSVENVVAEMITLADEANVSHFEFQDDNFFVRPDRALAIAEGYAATGRDFSFAFLTRADQVVKGERYFAALRRAGLRYVSVGIESGSEASLQRMVKETGVEINRRALHILHQHDVAAQVEFIMFEPGSTLEDLRANLAFIEQQGLFGYFPPLVTGRLLLMPGTPVRQQIEAERGAPGAIHQILPYDFPDPAVGEIYELINDFQRNLGNPWYELAFHLLDTIPAREIAHRAVTDAQSVRQLAALKLEFFALTRLPYQLVREALHAASAPAAQLDRAALLARVQASFNTIHARVAELTL